MPKDSIKALTKPEFLPEIALKLRAAEFHWYFIQGFQALNKELYIPGLTCLILGIEASLRVTMYQLNSTMNLPIDGDLKNTKTLCNSLLKKAKDISISVEVLAFPEEKDFIEKLPSKKDNVRIVQLRHDLAHGNILSFINRDLGDDLLFFTPECLRDTANIIVLIVNKWIDVIADFRNQELNI